MYAQRAEPQNMCCFFDGLFLVFLEVNEGNYGGKFFSRVVILGAEALLNSQLRS